MTRMTGKMMLVGMVVLVAVLVGCKGDKGPAGPAGTAACMDCHTDSYAVADYIRPYELQYDVSVHATGDTYLRTESPCSGCHTTEGYQQYVENPGTPPPAVEQSTHIGCFACHAPHTNQSFALRKVGATTLMVGGGTYDKEESNTCAMCHQLRKPSTNFFAAGFAGDSLTSSRFAGHHGPQSNILSGQGLWVYSGKAPYPNNARHNTAIANGCVNCHMAGLPSDALAGGHTFAITYGDPEVLNSKGCTCHPTMTDEDALTFVDESKSAFLAALNDTLAPKLLALGLLKQNDDGTYSPNDKRRDGTGRRVIWTADEMGAVFNFGALTEDRSGGVHNKIYARAVLDATMTFANAHH
jgi:hypothetical protein